MVCEASHVYNMQRSEMLEDFSSGGSIRLSVPQSLLIETAMD